MYPSHTYLRLLSFGLALVLSSCGISDKKTADDSSAETKGTLIQGTFFNGTNGLYFDKEDRLHVASVVSRLIGVVDTDSGAILDTLSQAEGIEGPDDLIFGPDGSLYHTSILTGEVGRLQPDGTASKQFVSPGVNPITFSDDGRLFVALDFQGDGLYELDPELKEPPSLIIKELGWLNGMDFGPDGYLYGPIWSKGHIVKIDVDKGTLEVIIDDLVTPAAVKFNSKGMLYTVDHNTGIVYEVDVDAKTKREVNRGFKGGDNIAFNSKDELFLSHAQDGSLYEVMMDGTSREIIAPSLCNATDIEILNGQIIAPDLLSMKIINAETGKIENTKRHMIGRPGIIGPFTIDVEGDTYVMTSWFSNEVQVWDAATDLQIADYHNYIVPLNAIQDNGQLIVAELGMTMGAAKVTRLVDGQLELLVDASGGLAVPSGLAANQGNIYVADYFNGVVMQVAKDNVKLESPINVVSDLKMPEGIQIGPDGQLIIVETGADQVVSYDLATNERKVLVADIPLGVPGPPTMAPTWKLSDVHFDNEGSLYVPSDVDNRIYKIKNVL